MPKLPSFLGIRRGLSSGSQNEPKDERVDGEENLNDHVEIDFSASAPSQVSSHQPAATTEPQTENSKKQSQGKPQGKVSPFTNMHHKLNFIPHSQRDKLNAQFLATLPGVLKIAQLVSFEINLMSCAFILGARLCRIHFGYLCRSQSHQCSMGRTHNFWDHNCSCSFLNWIHCFSALNSSRRPDSQLPGCFGNPVKT